MRWHKRLFLKLEKKTVLWLKVLLNQQELSKAREKETDNQKIRHPKISGPSRGKRSRSRYFKIPLKLVQTVLLAFI